MTRALDMWIESLREAETTAIEVLRDMLKTRHGCNFHRQRLRFRAVKAVCVIRAIRREIARLS